MKSTGIVRKIDSLGRIIIAIETRRRLDIDLDNPLEFYKADDGKIIIKKYAPACVFCDSLDSLKRYRGKLVCRGCINDL